MAFADQVAGRTMHTRDRRRLRSSALLALAVLAIASASAAQVHDGDPSWQPLLEYRGRVDGLHTATARVAITTPIDELYIGFSESLSSSIERVRLTRVDGTREELVARGGTVASTVYGAWVPLCARSAIKRVELRFRGAQPIATRGAIRILGRDRGGPPAGAFAVPCATDVAALARREPYSDLALGASLAALTTACTAHGGRLEALPADGSATHACAPFDGGRALATMVDGALDTLRVELPDVTTPEVLRRRAREVVAPFLARYGRPVVSAARASCEPVFYDGASDCWERGTRLEYVWSAPNAMALRIATVDVEHELHRRLVLTWARTDRRGRSSIAR